MRTTHTSLSLLFRHTHTHELLGGNEFLTHHVLCVTIVQYTKEKLFRVRVLVLVLMRFSKMISSSSTTFTTTRLHYPTLSPFLTDPRRFVSFRRNPMADRNFTTTTTTASASKLENHHRASSFQGGESFFRSVLGTMESVYLNRNPTAKAILELVKSVDGGPICYDHIAFRTFGVDGYGIDSMARFFLDYGYTQQEELKFPAKKLKALWFSPPPIPSREDGSGVNGPLPRVFISELLVDQMSPPTQDIIKKYTQASSKGNQHATLSSALGSLTWEKPLSTEFHQLARESEYAAWTLVNGYAVNHVTISVHQLRSRLHNIKSLNKFVTEKGFKLNSEGGVLKVSPDGLLQQSSTAADSVLFHFYDGVTEPVPCSYIEFAERFVLPQYKDLPEGEVKEIHRRDGFEVGNADKIFESTSKEQVTRR